MSPQRFDQALFSEFLFSITKGFGYAVTVEQDRVSSRELAFRDRAIPFFKKSQYGARGVEPFKSVIAAQDEGAEMTAIRVAQALSSVIVFGEEEGGVGAVGRILAKELIHGSQEALRLIQSDSALAAQVRLQVGHQKSGSNSFS